MSRSILDRPIYTFTRYVYYFFIVNFYFLTCNILFLVSFYLVEFIFENILLFYIALIPTGPSITAVLATMRKLVVEKTISPTRDYFKTYKQNFWPTMKYWLIQLTIFLILSIDIFYSINRSNIFSPFFLILMIVCFFIMLYAFPIISRFEVKIKNLFIVSIYANFKFIKKTILNATTVLAFGFIYWKFPSLSVLFSVSLIGYFVMYNLQKPLHYLEVTMSKKS